MTDEPRSSRRPRPGADTAPQDTPADEGADATVTDTAAADPPAAPPADDTPSEDPLPGTSERRYTAAEAPSIAGLLDVSPHAIAGGLVGKDQEDFSRDEVKAAAEEFASREVPSPPDPDADEASA